MFAILRPPAAALFLVGLLFWSGCGAPVKPPTTYAKWTTGSYFHMDYPEGWKAEGGGKEGVLQWAEFKKGSCVIKANTDVSTSLIGDISSSANTMIGGGEELDPELAKEMAPAEQAHNFNKEKPRPDDLSKYKEEKESLAFNSGLGDARKSVFTATRSMGKVKGYRATFLGRDRGVTIYCVCPERDWKKFQPAYDKILESVTGGS